MKFTKKYQMHDIAVSHAVLWRRAILTHVPYPLPPKQTESPHQSVPLCPAIHPAPAVQETKSSITI